MTFNLLILLLFLPSASVLGWLLLNFMVARRTSTYMVVQWLMFTLFLFFTADAIYSIPGIPSEFLVYSHLVTVFSAPCVFPIIWLYFDRLRYGRKFKAVHFFWTLIPVSLTLTAVSLTDTIGAAQLAPFLTELYENGTVILENYAGTAFGHYYAWCHTIFRIAIVGELLFAVVYLMIYVVQEGVRFKNFHNYFVHDNPIRVIELQIYVLIIPAIFVLIKVLFTKPFLDTHLWLSISLNVLISVSTFFFNRDAWFGARKTITRTQAKHVMMYNYHPSIKGPIKEIMVEELLEDVDQDFLLRLQDRVGDRLQHAQSMTPREMNAVKDILFGSAGNPWDDSLLTRFQTVMLNEQLFLQPSLSLQDIAERLHTNKTYISKLVNNTYNLSFPEFLNTLRIDYAQQYIRNHPNAKQEEIARASGFLSASTFNNIFRKITGLTPKMWALKMPSQ
ncbi:MAG: helix-turn-helix transcriptional regulator [Bacteroidales bacterium]|nr:helix-turn-helix transcriptional regulator [Bacteroidales bacterium]